jgi:5-(carboxyamino)imidazole ribonucleotide synthase
VNPSESAGARAAGPASLLPLLPGATLGVLGGGQLGRMFVQAAQRLGYRAVVLDPDAESPAGLVAHRHLRADYLDAAALGELARSTDAVTTEFENVPAEALRALAATRRVAPMADAVAICQDRAREKAHFVRSGIPCAPYFAIADEAALARVDDALFPGILKTARLGYDGKGQIGVAARGELRDAWHALGCVPCVLERRLPIAVEASVVVARGADGHCAALPVQQNLHRGGILAVTRVPAPNLDDDTAELAASAARRIAAALDYVGVLCVEFFVLDDGSLVANEMAPRPHNSGHYSIDACDVSQFELQVRTLAGLPLVMPRLHSPAVMLNLMGDLWQRGSAAHVPDWARVLELPGAHLHLYGKTEARAGRKMGHVTFTADTAEQAELQARAAAAALGIAAW